MATTTNTSRFQPSDLAREIHRAQIERIENERHEREILTADGVSEGFAAVYRTIENWRASHVRSND